MDNSNSQQEPNMYSKPRRKTGPAPKYGTNQSKKMISMRLTPVALDNIKEAANTAFANSQADVIEQIMRTVSVQTLLKIQDVSREHNISPNEVMTQALDAYCAKHNISCV